MKTKSLLCAMLLCATMATTDTLYASSDNEGGFMPRWRTGEEWVLEASHKDLNADTETWLAPIYWTFKVRSVKELNGVRCYVLHVFSKNSGVKDQAILYLSTDDLRPVRVIDIYSTINGMKHNSRDYDPSYAQPIIAEDTIVPYDLPAFPLENISESSRAQGAIMDGLGKIKDAFSRKFAKVREVGGLRFKRNITQSPKLPKTEKKNAAQGARVPGEEISNSSVYSIQLSEERSDNNLSQTWRPGYPWAVATTRRDRKVRLVKYSSNNGGNE